MDNDLQIAKYICIFQRRRVDCIDILPPPSLDARNINRGMWENNGLLHAPIMYIAGVDSVHGGKPTVFCKQHTVAGMVLAHSRLCSYDSCLKRPLFNIEDSKTPAYCKGHANKGMVNLLCKRCLHDACMTTPAFNVRAAVLLHTASSFQRTAWWTSGPSTAYTAPARPKLSSVFRVLRCLCTVDSTPMPAC